MKDIDSPPVMENLGVRCIEISVPKVALLRNGINIHWSLSVYSLENHPVKKSAFSGDCEIFHFMVYDWKRTIKNLLIDHKIPYVKTQYFALDNIFSSSTQFVSCSDLSNKISSKKNRVIVDEEYEVNVFR